MIHPTFASLKHNRDPLALRIVTQRKYEPVPGTFRQAREHGKPSGTGKRLENQQNTLANHFLPHQPSVLPQPIAGNLVRKPLVKVQRSGKKNQAVYKSPLRGLQVLQQSSYQARVNQSRAEQGVSLMTPNLGKTNRSCANEEMCNASFLTQKERRLGDSEQGEVSVSSKNSFNDSFQLYQDLSYEEEKGREGGDFVNSSLELVRNGSELDRTVGQFPACEGELKTMKKSTHFYYNNNSEAQTVDKVLRDLDERSATSSVSSNMGSLKFSEKFKHYKRRQSISVAARGQRCFGLSDFKLLQQIGSGKYGLVFLARHNQTGFVCALKQVSKRVIREQGLQVPFMREVKIQLYLNHPNIVKLYGLFHDVQHVYLVMEYCSGGHLFGLMRERRQFEEGQVMRVLGNLFEAVAYIHSNGVIHRDLKPENIVIEHEVFKLCDFGWAAYACGDNRTTFCGTPLYVCPEVLKGEEYNEKADVWALGIITYELTFGRVPFAILNPNDLGKIINDPVYFPIWGQAAQKMVPLVRRMLSKRAEERPCLNEILASEVFRGVENGTGEAGRELSRLW